MTELKVRAFCGRQPATEAEFKEIWERALEIVEEMRAAQRRFPPLRAPEITVEYEEIPGWWQCLNVDADPPRRMGNHYKTQAEAEAFRDGWLDGWADA